MNSFAQPIPLLIRDAPYGKQSQECRSSQAAAAGASAAFLGVAFLADAAFFGAAFLGVFLVEGLAGSDLFLVTRPDFVLPRTFFSSTTAGA